MHVEERIFDFNFQYLQVIYDTIRGLARSLHFGKLKKS